MEEAIKQVTDDILEKRSKKELSHIVYLFGIIIVLLSSSLFTIRIATNANRDNIIEESLINFSQEINNLGKVVDNGFEALNKKTDSINIINEMEHKGIKKKMEIWKETQDQNTKKQFDLIDDLIQINDLKNASSILPSHDKNNGRILNNIQLKYNQNYSLSTQIYNELKKDSIKKNDNPKGI